MAVELTIERLSDELRGLVRHHGKVGFVAGALPGETVRAEIVRHHRRHDEYRLLQVLTPAGDRVTPTCPLVGSCGGCDLQHMAAEAQLRHKTAAVTALLHRVAGLQAAELEDPVESRPFGYRRRARLAFYVPRRGAPRFGFRELAGRSIVDVAHCPVLEDVLAGLPGPLALVLKTLRRPGAVGHVELAVSEASSGEVFPLIHVHTRSEPEPADLALLAEFARDRQAYASVRLPDGHLTGLTQPVAEPAGYLLPEFDVRIAYQPGDFLQGNAAVNRLLVSRVVGWLAESGTRGVVEGFAGVGNFSLALARRGMDVLALEGSAAMVQRAEANARANGLEAAFRLQDLTRPDPGLLADRDAVLIDPPRAGAAEFVEAAARSDVRSLLYVSCAAPTLARDAACLAPAGFRLSRLALVDMLPQTHHIECMALFERPR